jgi:hypothetical protein
LVGGAVASLLDLVYCNELKGLPARGHRTWIQARFTPCPISPEHIVSSAAVACAGLPGAKACDVIASVATPDASRE